MGNKDPNNSQLGSVMNNVTIPANQVVSINNANANVNSNKVMPSIQKASQNTKESSKEKDKDLSALNLKGVSFESCVLTLFHY